MSISKTLATYIFFGKRDSVITNNGECTIAMLGRASPATSAVLNVFFLLEVWLLHGRI
jgi:hypothetical protein